MSEFDTLAEFKNDLKQKIIDRNMAQSEAKFRQALLGQLCDQIDIELPEAMVNAQIDSLMNNYAARLEQQGISLEMYLQYMQMDMDKLRSDLKEPAEMQIKQQLALDAVVAAEGITVSDEDVDEEIKKAVASAEKELGESGRVLVRVSGTEPLVRVMLEGRDKDMIQTLAEEIAQVVKERLI